jgi:cytochrome c biogenesis protein CcmG/thiol:disulfide interchange protein DsbE
VGSRAPEFSLPPLDGGPPLRLEDARGSILLLNFWATWCKPCEEEMPAMERLHRDLGPRGLRLWAISVDAGRDEVVAFRDRLGLTFPILHDPDRTVADRYQSFRYPETWVVGRDGTLLARFIGPRDWDAPLYRERFDQLLGEPASPAAAR